MKKFLTKISYTVLPVWLLLVGMAVYLWATNDNSGDLMRLGLIDGGPEYTDSILNATALPDAYYESQDNDSLLRLDTCDVVVIGDSFSHGGGVGKRGDYVNYLAHDSQRRVVLFTPGGDPQQSPIQMAFDALNLGIIDSTNVRNLVVQEVERNIVARHSGFTERHTSLPKVIENQQPAKDETSKDFSPLLRVKDYVFYHFFGKNPIYCAELSRPLFGGAQPNKLYFYHEDVEMGFDVTTKQQQTIVNNYDRLLTLAQEKGVNLIIVIACDKYDLYQDFIVDNSFPSKTLNEDIEHWISPQGLENFVITKRVLHPLVEQGVKDVYLFNDTHWSPTSSRLIAAEVISKLK